MHFFWRSLLALSRIRESAPAQTLPSSAPWLLRHGRYEQTQAAMGKLGMDVSGFLMMSHMAPAAELAAQAVDGWTMADIDVRGEQVERALWARPLLWYAVRPLQQIMLVVVADPAQSEHDDLLFCTDLTIPPELVASLYAGRWSIEDTFRNTKQLLGGEQPQTWKAQGPERAAALSFWTYSAIWLWYLTCHDARPTWRTRPWYPGKRTPPLPTRRRRSAVRCGSGAFSTLPSRPRSSRKSRLCSSMYIAEAA